MAIRSAKELKGKIQVNLNGPEGNAFVLLGMASSLGKQLEDTLLLRHGVTPAEVIKEMQAGDYENLIQTFDKYFGDYVDLYR